MPSFLSLRHAAAALAVACAACASQSTPDSSADSSADSAAGAASSAAAPATPATAGPATATLASAPRVTVYKTPSCGCCKNWVEHLRANGFDVVAVDTNDLAAVKAAHGVTRDIESCHTAVVDGYVIEGHVPADLVAKLLTERPDVAGLAVPGMPMGSPGMEGPMKEPYDVLAFQKDGRTTVYAHR
ncbi:MAG TPA: DUF411 domain-containing protein [Gemmatimonadaceae bacterium]|nr:DUF411 domain-containing protein [Gemmatimonadaceae bacterium]